MAGVVGALGWLAWALAVCWAGALVMTSVPDAENNLALILVVIAVGNVLVWGGFALMIRIVERW